MKRRGLEGMRAAVLLSALLAPLACTWTEVRPIDTPRGVVEPGPAEQVATAEPVAPVEPPQDEAVVGEPTLPIGSSPTFRIGEVVGTSPEVAGAILAAATDAIEVCRGPGGPGIARIRFTADATVVRFDIEPGTTIAEGERECVLGALGATDIEGPLEFSLEPSTSPSERTPPVQSVIVIEW